jgi:two-component system, OmpR family, response regulator ChvI
MTIAPSPPEAPIVRHLMLVDDDALFLGVFAANLQAAGYTTTCFNSPSEALAMLESAGRVDGCIIDLEMPEMDGLSFLRALRERALSVPLMVVTAHNGPMFEEAALELGALDFVDKSRGFPILMRRLERLLTPPQTAPERAYVPGAPISAGSLYLVPGQRQAIWNGEDVALTRTEMAVIELLVTNAGSHVGYREIYDVIKIDGFMAGNGEDGYRTNVRAAIKRIRRKFNDADPSFDALENYPGVGYRWRDDG